MGKYVPYTELGKILSEVREGKKVVLAGGCFDILCEGHIHFLKKAKEYGDILVVNVVNTKRMKRYKGPERPAQSQLARAKIVAGLESVDYSSIHLSVNYGPTTELARLIKPDVMVQGGKKFKDEEKKMIYDFLGYKVRFGYVKRNYGVSTTRIYRKILRQSGLVKKIRKGQFKEGGMGVGA